MRVSNFQFAVHVVATCSCGRVELQQLIVPASLPRQLTLVRQWSATIASSHKHGTGGPRNVTARSGYITTNEAREMFGLSRKRLSRWAEEGLIEYERAGKQNRLLIDLASLKYAVKWAEGEGRQKGRQKKPLVMASGREKPA